MRANNKTTTFILLMGLIVLGVFTTVLALNLLPNNESGSYYGKEGKQIQAKIESIEINNGVLEITTSGLAKEYCVKSTKTYPDGNNICWKEIIENKAFYSVYKDTKYYVWIKDTNNIISEPKTINYEGL